MAGAAVPAQKHLTRTTGYTTRRRIGRVGLYVLCIFLVFLFAFPLYYMVIMSFMTSHETEIWPPLLVPLSFHWQNYQLMASYVPLLRWLWNTARYAFFAVLGTTMSSALVGYGFARFRFPFRNTLFLITLATMMIPGQITLIPQFVLFTRIKWLDTYLPLVVPTFLGGGAFYIFLMRQFVMTLPRDLDEAALIDGASYPRILLSVLMPLMTPALATVAIMSFMGAWNDFMGPFIYLRTSAKLTLSVGMRLWEVGGNVNIRSEANLMMAMAVVTAVPCLILFFSAQNVFVRGIATSGIKG